MGLLVGCAANEPRPSGPPPEYEPPRVLAWDAGGADPTEHPLESAAVGGWLEDPDAGASDGGPGHADTETSADGAAVDAAPVEAGPTTVLPSVPSGG